MQHPLLIYSASLLSYSFKKQQIYLIMSCVKLINIVNKFNLISTRIAYFYRSNGTKYDFEFIYIVKNAIQKIPVINLYGLQYQSTTK